MNPTYEELEELQEQLILIYRAINQNKMFNRFFCEGLDISGLFKNESSLIKKLNEIENIENLLRKCIIELEEMKQGKTLENEMYADDIISIYNLEELYRKYGMENPLDIDKLEIKRLLISID